MRINGETKEALKIGTILVVLSLVLTLPHQVYKQESPKTEKVLIVADQNIEINEVMENLPVFSDPVQFKEHRKQEEDKFWKEVEEIKEELNHQKETPPNPKGPQEVAIDDEFSNPPSYSIDDVVVLPPKEKKFKLHTFLGYGKTGVKIKITGESYELVDQNDFLIGLGVDYQITDKFRAGAFWLDTETYGLMGGYKYDEKLTINILGGIGVQGANATSQDGLITATKKEGFILGIYPTYQLSKDWGVGMWVHSAKAFGGSLTWSF